MSYVFASCRWLDKYKPRNTVPWIVIVISYSLCVVMLLGIRWRLSYENKQRDKLQAENGVSGRPDPALPGYPLTHGPHANAIQSEDDEYGYVDEVLDDGTKITHKVDKAFKDLTDKQNLSFRSVHGVASAGAITDKQWFTEF
jgi:hypothetical protein